MWACGHIFTFISVLSLFFFCFLKPPPTPSIAFHPTHIFIPCHFLLFSSSPRRRRRWFVVYNNTSIHRSAGTWMRQTTYGTAAAAAAARGSYLETRMTTLTCVFVMPSKVAFISFPFLCVFFKVVFSIFYSIQGAAPYFPALLPRNHRSSAAAVAKGTTSRPLLSSNIK